MMGTKLPHEIQSKSEWEAVGVQFWESKEFANDTNEQTWNHIDMHMDC